MDDFTYHTDEGCTYLDTAKYHTSEKLAEVKSITKYMDKGNICVDTFTSLTRKNVASVWLCRHLHTAQNSWNHIRSQTTETDNSCTFVAGTLQTTCLHGQQCCMFDGASIKPCKLYGRGQKWHTYAEKCYTCLDTNGKRTQTNVRHVWPQIAN